MSARADGITSKTPHQVATDAQSRRAIRISLVFLCLIVIVSFISYQSRLGFYSDDWLLLALMHNSSDQSFAGLFHALYVKYPARPVQLVIFVSLYKLFHFSPLGYHVFNAVVLVLMALLLFLLLLQLEQPMLLSASVAALYILLPNYSTDRFWLAAFQADASLALYLLSFYSDLRSLRDSWFWKFVSLFSLALSVFAYEVVVPLFAFNIFVVLWKGRWSRKARWSSALTIAALALCGLVKREINIRPVQFPSAWLDYAVSMYDRAFFVHFFQYGVALPHVVFKILHNHLHAGALIVSLIAGLLVAFLLFLLTWQTPESIAQTSWKKVIGAGLVVFVLGYAIFLISARAAFTKTGVDNRMAIAAALGVAAIYVGLIGWFVSLLPVKFRKCVFCGMLAVLCAAETLITNTVAYYWTGDYQKELTVQHAIFRSLPQLPAGTTLIIDGVCAYYGPAEVLTAYWDASGIIQIHYDDPTLRGDVISPRIQVKNSGLLTDVYGTKHFYPYSTNLLLYNLKTHQSVALRDRKLLVNYLRKNWPETNLNCPGSPGYGVPVF